MKEHLGVGIHHQACLVVAAVGVALSEQRHTRHSTDVPDNLRLHPKSVLV